MTRTGTPQEFYMLGVDLLRTVPYDTVGGDSLLIECVVIPEFPDSNAQPVNLHESFSSMLVEYASYMMLLEMRQLEPAVEAFTSYAEKIGLFDTRVVNKTNKEWKLGGVGSDESWR